MVYVKLENGKRIYKGNFTFIYDVTKSEELFEKFLEAEQVFKLNYIDFLHKLRMAYEAFALFEECKKRKALSEYANKTDEEVKGIIVQEITTPASTINYKNIVISMCSTRIDDFLNIIDKYSDIKHEMGKHESRRTLKSFIRYIYDFGSKSSHINDIREKRYIPNKENCIKVISSFHDFLTTYYRVSHKFDSTLIPIKDYFAISKSVSEDMGLNLDKGKQLFVKENKFKNSFNIFSSDSNNISLSQKRDIETINRLWEDNYSDPSNIIRLTENINGSNNDYKFQVYSLPAEPMKLNRELLDTITMDDKSDIIKGICKGILSMHEYDPPFYHRNICPESFYIFKIKGKFKALLARFDCTKDTSEDAKYTVISNVEKKISIEENKLYFAPEVIQAEIGTNINWEKADVFALAQTCFYILVGQVSNDIEKRMEYLTECNIPEKIKYLLLEMTSDDVGERPSIREVVSSW